MTRTAAIMAYDHGASNQPLLGETIGENFNRMAMTHTDREAVVDRFTGRRWTYAELHHDVLALAHGLIRLGIDQGDRVGIWAPNCPEWTVLQYATAEIGAILTVEATRDLPSVTAKVTTPLAEMDHRKLAGPEPVLVAVLRAGLGLLEGAMGVLPEAPVGHVGLVRDEHTLTPSQYLLRMPPEVVTRGAILFDPMLATGGTLAAAIQFLTARGADDITAICLLAAPEGCARLEHELEGVSVPVTVVTAAMDEKLNEKGYIVPGLGDAGDRLYGLAE